MKKLYIPRRKVMHGEVPGGVVDVRDLSISFLPSSALPVNPLMKNRTGKIEGVLSGVRSSIIWDYNGYDLRGKGDGLFLDPVNPRRPHHDQPSGGQTLSYANEELIANASINKILKEEGVGNVATPLCRFDFEGFEFQGEPCSSSVFVVEGDTRFDELLFSVCEEIRKNQAVGKGLLNTAAYELKEGFRRIGVYTGSLMGKLYSRGFVWGTSFDSLGLPISSNAHMGNLVLFQDEAGLMRVGLVDFDAAQVLSDFNPRERKKVVDFELESIMKAFGLVSQPWEEIAQGVAEPGFYREIADPFTEGFMRGMDSPSFAPIVFDKDSILARAFIVAETIARKKPYIEKINVGYKNNLNIYGLYDNKKTLDKKYGYLDFDNKILNNYDYKHNIDDDLIDLLGPYNI